jgi:hypothetical protein
MDQNTLTALNNIGVNIMLMFCVDRACRVFRDHIRFRRPDIYGPMPLRIQNSSLVPAAEDPSILRPEDTTT